jgi:hypothetical protein
MDGAQLAQMPLEMRQEYFKATRQPPSNVDFDNMSYEALSVKFNLSPISNLPYNQQVLNALMFLAKMKAGASEQEMQTYGALAPTATEFTRSAFFTARKILSQIGDECIQNLVSTVEAGPKPVNSEGAVDMECGNYKFKVSAGGEISLSTTQFDQSNKSFRGLIATALMQTMNNPEIASSDPKMAEMNEKGKEIMAKFATTLIPDDAMAIISQDPKMLSELQKLQLKDSQGNDLGPAVDADGNLNPAASMGAYRDQWLDVSKSLLKGKNSPLKSEMASMLLKSMLRGDDRVPPEMAPNHLITVNGVFPMTDDYFAEISKLADIDIKPAKDLINSSNIGNYKSSAAERMKKFRALVEQNEEKPGKKPSLKDILMDTASINPMEFIIQNFVDNNDFTLNASLLPGFTPKDLNAVQYNYLTIGKKTIKIPVENSEKVHSQMLGEGELYINDLLIESLSNNFVLRSLSMSGLLTNSETVILENGNSMLLESFEQEMILKNLYERAVNRAIEDPEKLEWLINVIEEYKRDYKKEYKNYHGKPKQRKERAARTAARELMIKKGKVRKGDGKDIDHKKPLRNGGSKGINNLRVRSKSENRSDNGHEEGETQDKGSCK